MKIPLEILIKLKSELDPVKHGETDKRYNIFKKYSEYGSRRTLERNLQIRFGRKRKTRIDKGEIDQEKLKIANLILELKLELAPKYISSRNAMKQLLEDGKIDNMISVNTLNRILTERKLIPEHLKRPPDIVKKERKKQLEKISAINKITSINILNEELENTILLLEDSTNKKEQLQENYIKLQTASSKLKHENHRLIIENQLIKDIVKIYGNKYGLDNLRFINDKTPIIIGCTIHGLVTVDTQFFKSNGCPICEELERFKRNARELYGDKYIYDLIKTLEGKLTVYCTQHKGLFYVTMKELLAGKGCGLCMDSIGVRVGVKEYNTFKPILESINDAFEHQYPVHTTTGIYHIDFYYPKLNICVEFDESHHKHQIKKDKDREKIIKEILGCTFIRINEEEFMKDSSYAIRKLEKKLIIKNKISI